MAKKSSIYTFAGTGLSRGEKLWGQKQYKLYKEKYHIERLSDLTILEQLVFREAIQNRIKEKIGKLAKNKLKGHEEIIPPHMMKSLTENENCILNLREKLGLFEERKQEDPYQYIKLLKEKFKRWQDENSASRSLKCPHCSKMILLAIRADQYKSQKHPFFKDRIFGNEHLVKLFMDKKITEEDIAKILGVSADYTQFLVGKWYKNKEKLEKVK